MKTRSLPIVVDVARDGLRLCTSEHPEPLVLKFSSDLVSNLEIVNPGGLSAAIKQFVESNKLKPGNAVFILSETVYFEKNYPGPAFPVQKDMEEFIDSIPLSATSSKVFHLGNEFKQIVINRDFYESLRRGFEELGFKVTAIVPWFAMGPAAPAEFTADTCRVIYKKMDQIISDSIIGASDEDETLHQKEQAYLERHKDFVVVLSLVFIIFAGVVAFITIRRPAQRIVTITPTVSNRERPTPSPVIEEPVSVPIATPSAALLKALNVQVLNGSGVSGQAASLSALLKKNGFAKVQTGNSAKRVVNTTITATPYAATAAGEFVTQLVSSLYSEPVFVEDAKSEFDFSILISP
jgi:hypothetical protein